MIRESSEHKVLGFLALVTDVATDMTLGIAEIMGATAKAIKDLQDQKIEEDKFFKIVED